jgi:ABC-type uncharacterized transport system substrate-binding protein
MNTNINVLTATPLPGNSTFLRVLTLLVMALLLTSPVCFGQTVVVIESYHSEYKWDHDYLAAIQSQLGKDNDIHVLELDTKRLPKPEWPEKVATIQAAVNKLQPDIAILGDDNAFLLMAEYMVEKQIPVVFFGVNGGLEQYPILKNPLVTGILERPFFAQSVRHIRKVLRQHERFLILMDDSPTMRNAVNEYFGEARQAQLYGSQVNIVLTNSKSAWLQTVYNAHQQYDAIIVGTHHTIRDEEGRYVSPKDLINQAFLSSQIPIFSFWDISIGRQEAIGGFTVSAHQEGITAARLASLVLNGVRPDQVPQIKSLSGQYVYSKSGLTHWNLKLSPLIASQSIYVE